MPTLTYSGNYGTVSGTGTNGVSTTLTAPNVLPSNAVITAISYSLEMSASSYSSSLDWRLYFITIYNGPSVNGDPYDATPMYSNTYAFTGNFGSINYNGAFTSTNISVTSRANCEGAPSSFLKGITITITYELPASPSAGQLSSSIIIAGNSLTLTISNASLNLLTHTVLWKLNDSYQAQQNINQGIGSSNFTIPMEWINGIINAPQGSAAVILTTYQNGVLRGSNTYNFTIVVPEDIVPSITSFVANRVDNLVPNTWNIYVQKKSKVNLVTTASAAYGAYIVQYSIQGDGYLGTVANYTTGIINGSGVISYNVVVTDSRGRTANANVSILVYSYDIMSITNTIISRCLSDGTLDDNGTYGIIGGDITFSSCNNNNSITSYKIYYKNVTDPDTSYSIITENGISGNTYIFGNDNLLDINSYNIKIVVNDTFSEIVQIITLPSALFTIFLRTGGTGVAFGKASTRDKAVEINGEWGLWIGDNRVMSTIISDTEPVNGGPGVIWLKPVPTE